MSTVALTVEGLVVPTNGWVCDTRATVEGSSLRPCLRLAHHGREGRRGGRPECLRWVGRWLRRRRRMLPHDLHLQLKARRRPRGGARPAGLAVNPADCVPARDPLGISHVPARNLDDDDVV